MANCGPTSGLALPCKTFMPGLRRIFIASFYSGSSIGDNFTYTTDVNSVITAGTLTTGFFYQYDLTKEAGETQDAMHFNPQNGTTSYESTINVYLSQYSTAVRNKIVTLGKAKLLLITEDRNGQYFVYGTDGTGVVPSTSNGVDLMESTATSGKAYGADQNGYNLVFNCTEKVPALEISSTVIAGLTSI
ncbi:MAG TPA: hypothetical protein VNX68_12735 [Nitrosopumilaceae archaeon]|jgi:hypothetical protein|nr:hypothetical protein [Nitrosopumilaceae archaeon]